MGFLPDRLERGEGEFRVLSPEKTETGGRPFFSFSLVRRINVLFWIPADRGTDKKQEANVN